MRCSHCQAAWPDELQGVLKYCGACGGAMTAAGSVAMEEPPRATARNEPGGELRFVTVLFADLAGFRAYAAGESPDDAGRIIARLLQRLGSKVEEHGGAVDKFVGDAVMATFGLPRPDPAAIRNAVRAAMAMQVDARQFCHLYGLELELRVGIHAGEVMLRELGGSWTVMGDTVNTASRIQSTAPPGKVWISRPVYEEVRRFFTVAIRPAVELRGKKHAIQPYEVLQERATPLLPLPPFVGRDAEWGSLQAQLRSAVEGSSLRAVILRGAAGVGKSRLVWELRDWVQRQEEVYRFDVVQYDGSDHLPSHGLNVLLRGRFDLNVDLDEDALLAALRDRMAKVNPFVEAGRGELTLELFAFVLGVLRNDFHIWGVDGKARWESAFVEIRRWLEGWAASTPWVLVFEDAQKGDSDTAAFLDWALRVPWAQPVLVIATVRDEDYGPESHWHAWVDRWGRETRVVEVRVRELPAAVLAPALAALGGDGVSPAVARRVAEHAEGNPLFATELILLLKDRGFGTGDQLGDEPLLPATIREVMEARIERLGTEGKEVAKRGAIVGRRFTREALQRIWEASAEELESGMRVLGESETIYDEASQLSPGEIMHVFRHGRMQEAALARVPREDRLRWLLSLEAWAQTRLDSLGERWEAAGPLLVPLMARSREQRGDAWMASLWYEVLGLLHRKHHRLKEAGEALRRASAHATCTRRLVLLRHVAEVELFSEDAEKAARTAIAAKDAPGGSAGEVPSDIHSKLVALAPDSWSRWDVMDASLAETVLDLTRAEALSQLGRVDEATQAFRTIEERLDHASDDIGVRLRLTWGRVWAWFLCERLGRPREAGDVLRVIRNRIDLRAPELQEDRLALLHVEGYVESRLGHYDRAAVIADEQMQASLLRRDERQQRRAWNSKGIVANARGDLAAARSHYEKALHISQRIGDRLGEARALHNLGIVHYDMAQWDMALRLQERYLTLSQAIGNRVAESFQRIYLGALAMEMGNCGEARAFLRKARQIAEENRWPRLVALARAFTGQVEMMCAITDNEPDLLPLAIAELEASEEGWMCFDHAGELAAYLTLATHLAGGKREAHARLLRARQRIHASWLTARAWLDATDCILRGQPVAIVVAWFGSIGFCRAVGVIDRVARTP